MNRRHGADLSISGGMEVSGYFNFKEVLAKAVDQINKSIDDAK
jgi:hypothetical protein